MVMAFGRNLADASLLAARDPDVQSLIEAKRLQDNKELGRLLPLLRQRYGEKLLTRVYRAV
jgi:hypothetical protein